MEDNAGYSREKYLEEILNRKHFDINGKKLNIPRKLADRIFKDRVEDLRSAKFFYKDDGTFWARTLGKYRYKPSALSNNVQNFVQHRLAQDFADTLQSAECVKGSPLDCSEINDIIMASQIALEDRNALQRRLQRDFYKSAKL